VRFFDGPAGSQVPASVVDAVAGYLTRTNANHGGAFATSRESDALLDEAHRAAADFFGVADPSEIAFGANMTSLTLALSRALARDWRSGDEIVVTRLDHDANVTPWTLAARDAGAIVRHVEIRKSDCTLDLDSLRSQLSPRTRLVAVGCASNAVGTINPVAKIVEMAHAVGALAFLDAVHLAPHRRLDAAGWNADFAVCSAYKFFGPHVGLMWGRRDILEGLPAYKLRPATNELPGKWMTGTQSHEGIAGVLAAIEYLANLGRAASGAMLPRAAALTAAFDAIETHERELTRRLLAGLAALPRFRLLGIADVDRLDDRVATFGMTHASLTPLELARRLDERGTFAWHGNFYALPLTEALGLEPQGMLRIGLLHYNTAEEVARLLAALAEI
jgi:cysteine desulfurase family protein (TIGR01976 family)